MKICIIHHVEPMWEGSFNKDELLTAIIEHLENNHYDKVLLTTLEGVGYEELKYYWTHEELWGYGWEDTDDYTEEEYKELLGVDPKKIIPVSSPHERAFIYEWIEDLKGHEIHLMGGHRDECLLDLQETLDHLEIPYHNIDECIYG